MYIKVLQMSKQKPEGTKDSNPPEEDGESSDKQKSGDKQVGTDQLEAINKEIDEGFRTLDRYHAQCQWYLKNYALALTALLGLGGYLGTEGYPVTKDNTVIVKALCIIGVAYGFALFLLGWLLLGVLSNKIASICLVHKHLAVMRKARLHLLKDIVKEASYVFQLTPSKIQPIKSVSHIPKGFFVLNYLVLLGSFFFFSNMYPKVDLFRAISFSLGWGVGFGTIYPRTCVAFFCTMDKLESHHTMLSLNDALQGHYDKRGRLTRGLYPGVYLFLYFLACLNVALGLLTLHPRVNAEANTYLATAIISALLFGTFRYLLEILVQITINREGKGLKDYRLAIIGTIKKILRKLNLLDRRITAVGLLVLTLSCYVLIFVFQKMNYLGSDYSWAFVLSLAICLPLLLLSILIGLFSTELIFIKRSFMKIDFSKVKFSAPYRYACTTILALYTVFWTLLASHA